MWSNCFLLKMATRSLTESCCSSLSNSMSLLSINKYTLFQFAIQKQTNQLRAPFHNILFLHFARQRQKAALPSLPLNLVVPFPPHFPHIDNSFNCIRKLAVKLSSELPLNVWHIMHSKFVPKKLLHSIFIFLLKFSVYLDCVISLSNTF